MTAPVTPACAWPVLYPDGTTCLALDGMTPEERAAFEEMASAFLASWTGYGVCGVKIRPCRLDCLSEESTFWGNGPYTRGSSAGGYGSPWTPALINGQWFNLTCGTCAGDKCHCGGGSPALLLPGPVASINEVLIDATALDPAAYRVDNNALLVRTDGGSWPICQDINAPTTEPGTWQVDYGKGREVPAGGQYAAGLLACEMAKGATGDRSCALPQRMQTLSRQGITVTMLDSFDDLEKGRTGIWMVDSWVASVTKPRRGGTVRSVDIPHPRNRTTTWSAP
jgi:hypothetical protein